MLLSSDCMLSHAISYFNSGNGFIASSTKCLTLDCFNHQGGFQEPDVLELNCTSLTKTSDIFTKVFKF